MSDLNLRSFNGPSDSGQTLELHNEVFDGGGYSDTIKCSTGLTRFKAHFGEVLSGSEDALDVNNECSDLELRAERWVLRGQYGITIKGGSSNIMVAGEIAGQGKECDVDLGNWSDQSHTKTTNVSLNLWREDGSPVRIRVLHASAPRLINGPYKYVFPSPKLGLIHTLIVWCFMTLRRWGFFR